MNSHWQFVGLSANGAVIYEEIDTEEQLDDLIATPEGIDLPENQAGDEEIDWSLDPLAMSSPEYSAEDLWDDWMDWPVPSTQLWTSERPRVPGVYYPDLNVQVYWSSE